MGAAFHDRLPPSRQPLFTRPGSCLFVTDACPTLSAQPADTPAGEWQVVLQLKTLFERDPALISSLLANSGDGPPSGLLTTLLAAVREALAAHPDSAALHYQAAKTHLRVGNRPEARALLRRALELDPACAEALVLLAEVCVELHDAQQALVCLRQALALVRAASGARSAEGQGRRGNEPASGNPWSGIAGASA